jgi:NADPH-dependent 2,4-dienoyl-CoA reductase/sulfur reductase-like enzyme
MTTGAAQTLLRSYRVLAGKRIVIAGNGPLNFQVAIELQKAGADIAAVAELAPAPSFPRAGALAGMLANSPSLLLRGMRYLHELRGANIPVYFGAILKKVQPGPSATLASVDSSAAKYIEVTADVLCMGYGFLPSNELLRLLQCRHDYDEQRRHLVTARDNQCRTDISGVFAIGDCCGLSGARAAIAEGIIAGHAAAAEATGRAKTPLQGREIAAAYRILRRHRRFQAALWRFFAPSQQFEYCDPDTEICRCESVSLSDIETIVSGGSDVIGTVKRQSRLGMGRCQGRYCIYETVERIGWSQGKKPIEFSFAAPRPPVKPQPLSVFDSST